jgi:hypothetical protein
VLPAQESLPFLIKCPCVVGRTRLSVHGQNITVAARAIAGRDNFENLL